MPREKELFRDNLERLDKAFPDKELLMPKDIKRYTGLKDTRSIKRRYGVTGEGISKVKFASMLS